MSTRSRLMGLIGAATITLAACATTGSTSPPALSTPQASEAASDAPAIVAVEAAPLDAPAASPSDVPDLPRFCVEIARRLTVAWPNLDASAAASFGSAMNEWAVRPGVAVLEQDLATVAMWVLASAGAAASPPPDVHVAVDHIRTFAKTHC